MSKMTNKKLALLALAGLGAVASGPAFAAGMTVDTKGGIEVFELDESNYWFKLGGRLFFDQVWFDTEDDSASYINFPSGAHIRSARLTLKGGVGCDWVYKWDIDVKDRPDKIVFGFGEAFIGYSGCKDLWFAIGQISVPFGLENWASLSELTFMEPSIATDAFAPGRGLGIYAEWHGHMFTAAAALYHEPAGFFSTGDVLSQPAINASGLPIAGTGPLDSDAGSDDLGFGARITFSPVHDEFCVYHAGISARWEDFHDNANEFNYWAGMELQSRQTPKLFTNIPPNSTDSDNVWGFELAGRWGPALVQAEYMIAKVNRDDQFGPFDLRNPPGDLDYHGYYIAASYVLTGESREYDFDSGTFGTVHPSCCKGAWEIGIRFSFVDFLDNDALAANDFFEYVDFVPANAVDVFDQPMGRFAGNNFRTGISSNDFVGDVHSTTIGLTWYTNENVRFMANYVHIDLPNSSDADAFGLRAQVVWG